MLFNDNYINKIFITKKHYYYLFNIGIKKVFNISKIVKNLFHFFILTSIVLLHKNHFVNLIIE